MTRYTEAKSKFVKEKIKKTKWKSRAYIDDLLKIEQYVLGGSFGMVMGYLIKYFEEGYPEELKAIWLELNPKGYAEMIEYDRKEKEKKEELGEEKQDKEDWKKMGGK